MQLMKRILPLLFFWLQFAGLFTLSASAVETYRCAPTRVDADGPFYRPGAPERTRVGEGYLLSGTVRSALDCTVLPGARIEIWLNGPDGRYGDPWRATLYAKKDGSYSFTSHVPRPYGSRPPHIHIIVNAVDHAELITQHYPQPEVTSATFDLILLPNN